MRSVGYPGPSMVVLAWAGLIGCGTTTSGSKANLKSGALLAEEVCDNGLDDDGNGQADDGCWCNPGATQRCFVGAPGMETQSRCTWGTQVCTGVEFGLWEPCGGYSTDLACQLG